MTSSDATGDILFAVDGPVATLTLNRPQARNALTFDMYRAITRHLQSITVDGPVRAVVLQGAGDKAFAAGTDISLFRDFTTAEQGLAYEREMVEHFRALEDCAVPTIAALTGAVTGGGAAIAACCDIRIGSDDLRFGVPIAKTLGNCLAIKTLDKLVGLVGRARTADILLTGRLIGSEQALAAGLVSEVHADAQATKARARALALEMAEMAPLTLRATRTLLNRLARTGAATDDRDIVGAVYGSHDFREGVAAFVAKRPPKWQGR
jgi:enoyl-CoA hydratase